MAQVLQIVPHSLDSSQIDLKLAKQYNNIAELSLDLRRIVPSLQEKGYLSASIDSIVISGSQYHLFYFVGKQYRWANLSFDSIPPALLVAAAINPQQYSNRPLRPKSLAMLSDKLLNYSEENGYPFARVWLSNIRFLETAQIGACLRIDLAEMRTIDSLMINGDVKISANFLYRYLDIAKHSVYNEKKLKFISQRIRELPFLQESSPWMIHFRPGDTRLSLFLKEKKANQLNAILGILPNNAQSGNVLLTADVQFALQNYLGHGESISASYQNLQVRSPRIKLDVVIPYLFRSPLGLENHFDYFSNNLQFRKVSFQTGIRYQISTADYLKFFYQAMSNRLIEIDSAAILATKQLPANIDVRSNGIGFELQNNHTDYKLNPHKGWQARMGITAFQRTVLPNNAIRGLKDGSGFDFSKLYDTLNKNSYLYHFNADIAYFVPLNKSFTLKIAYVGGFIVAPKVFQNELFQIGGFKLLRGFDEQSIFANQYQMFVTELRLRISQNSFAYLFSDNAWVQTQFNNYNREGWYHGFGLGTTLETKSGLFSIALALGQTEQIPLRLRESKISFGYIALF